jgi:hypothetical protein
MRSIVRRDMGESYENRRSGCSLPVAVWLGFCLAPQSGLAWLCFLLPSRPGELPGRPGEFRPEPPTDPDMVGIELGRASCRWGVSHVSGNGTV